ncbi:hypothetical protein GOP47_0009468 [Adiantum capillus-veneris]|uniref:Uncharacterized protein n=1 Tax=Adiantum capillus-veneris TaxID=13818 RepID=A0A9D4UX60_ADICA|nr:hypothetical protein GOP47_0009468 [Adiantum capillus-veneris]
MAKAAGVISFLVLALVATSFLQGPIAYAGRESGGMRRMLQVDGIISTPCNGATCTGEFYNTEYVTCDSNPGETLPAYSNCCVLQSCQPNTSGCTLHLQEDQGTVACTF